MTTSDKIEIGKPYMNPNGDIQCNATGNFGSYVLRKAQDGTWYAIQLFGAIGCICIQGASTAREALEDAEEYFLSQGEELSNG